MHATFRAKRQLFATDVVTGRISMHRSNMMAAGKFSERAELFVALDEAAPLRVFAASMGHALDPPIMRGSIPCVRLVDHFRLLQRLSVMGRDETCHMSLRPLTVGTTDFVVETLSGAADLADAMRRVAKAYNLLHGGNYNHVERRRDRLVYLIDDRNFPYAFDASSGLAHGVMEGVLIFLHAILSCAVGRNLGTSLRMVRSRRPRRVQPDGLLAFWGTRVRCNAKVYALEYDLSAEGMEIRSDVADVARVGTAYDRVIQMIAAREQSIAPSNFGARVADAIAGGSTELPQVARQLGVSGATLRRRLTEEAHRFRDIRADVLNRTARSLLEDRRHAAEVAETLGFADIRSFSRAFKAWNGVTPAAFMATRSAGCGAPDDRLA